MHGLIDQPLGDAGALNARDFKPRVTLHTTEGATYPGPGIYHHTHPTFTCDFKRRRTYQHCGIHRAAMALQHPSGTVETNRANNVQIELVGFADLSTAKHFGHPDMAAERWTLDDCAYIHSLLVHIRNAGHGFVFEPTHPWTRPRMSADHWRKFPGVCGHMHVPNNDHGDPGRKFQTYAVIHGT